MSGGTGSSGKLVVIGLFAVAVIGAFAFLFLKKGSNDVRPETGTTSAGAPPQGPSSVPVSQVAIEFLYGTEKQAFIEEVVAEFREKHPAIRVELKSRGSMDAVAAILEGREKPALFSPADTVALNLLISDWQQKTGKRIAAESGADAPEPLVVTPLVFVAWEDRGNALVKGEQGLTWRRLHEALGAAKGWPSIGGQTDWGFVKFGHTNPTRSNSGLQALLLMAYDFHGKQSGLEMKDVLDPRFQAFVKTIERGVPKFGDSTGTFMKEMVLYGPSKYDVVITYENLAIQSIPSAQGRWGNLRVLYPRPTMWSSHPLALVQADWVTKEQQAAARQLIAFLRARGTQQKALRHGFRPADPTIAIIDSAADNPFNGAKAYGVEIEVPAVVEPPPGPIIQNVLEMWNRTIGRP